MLNQLSLVNKIYPQSLISQKKESEVGTYNYVVKMHIPYCENPQIYCFDSLDKALEQVRENHSYYPNLSFEISSVFSILDERGMDEVINYEF